MKNMLITSAFMCLFTNLYAQEGLTFGFEIGAGKTLISLRDDDGRPSSQSTSADGLTIRQDNFGGHAVRFNVDAEQSGNWLLGTGLWFARKNMFIRNTDGSYTGVSHYQTTYLQLPILLKYDTEELAENLSLMINFGPLFQVKVSEKLFGGDGAHFWNLANNRVDIDPTRGQNGNGKAVDLFNPLDLGIILQLHAKYTFSDQLAATAGLGYSKSFFNMINPRLKFNDAGATPVSDQLKIRSAMLTFDLGIRYSF